MTTRSGHASGRRRFGVLTMAAGILALGAVTVPAGATVTGTTTRVSVASDGTQADSQSRSPEISADGRHVAFQSTATNLVAGDINLRQDVFVHDRQTGTTTRVSIATNGDEANNTSQDPSLSADGRYVAFSSTATNLVASDTNATSDVFVHDRDTGTTTRVSVGAGGTQANAASSAPAISANGSLVAFQSSAGNLTGSNLPAGFQNVFVHDRSAGTTTKVSLSHLPGQEVAGFSSNPAISGNGRYVAYQSAAHNVVENDLNNASDVFLHDRQTGSTARLSVAPDGTEANGASENAAVSAEGDHVAFESRASNLVTGDTNAGPDVFVRDRPAGVTSRVSVASDGTQGTPSAGNTQMPDISADGRFVSFFSFADLAPGDVNNSSDQYLHDRQKARTIRVNIATDGTHRDGNSSGDERSSVSGDGRYVAFDAAATNLVPDDTNGDIDIFVRDRKSRPVEPAVSVGDVRLHEGETGSRIAAFTVSLSKASTSTVTVDYATADGSALAPDDYAATAGTLSFTPGAISRKVKVVVAGDAVDEPHHDFQLRLSAPSGAYLGDSVGSGVIFDDDPNAGDVRMAIGDVLVQEGDAGSRAAIFNVSLSAALPKSVSVTFTTVKDTATAADFTRASGTLTFPAGSTSSSVKVLITGDTLGEGSETFRVVLTNPTSGITVADTVGQGTIFDND